ASKVRNRKARINAMATDSMVSRTFRRAAAARFSSSFGLNSGGAGAAWADRFLDIFSCSAGWDAIRTSSDPKSENPAWKATLYRGIRSHQRFLATRCWKLIQKYSGFRSQPELESAAGKPVGAGFLPHFS